MKTLIAITLSLGLSFVAFSQKLDYVVSAPYPVIDAFDKSYFSHNGEIMAVKTMKKAVSIQKWNAESLHETERNEFDDFEKRAQAENIKTINDKYYYFYSAWDRKNKLEQLYVREIDFESGKFVGNGKRLLYVEGKVTNAFGGGPGVVGGGMFAQIGTVGKFNIQQSYDHSKFLVQYRKYPERKKDKVNYDVIGFYVFDQEFNELTHSEIEMPYTEAQMRNIDYSIDARGNAYLLAKVYKSDKQRSYDEDGNINYRLELLKLPAGAYKMSTTPVEVEGIAVTELLLFEMPDNEMLCTGYYTDGTNLSNVSGLLMFKVNDKGQPSAIQKYPIPLDVVNMYSKTGNPDNFDLNAKSENMDFKDLQIKNLYVYSDGSILINGEQHYMRERTSGYSTGNVQTSYSFHYDDMLSTRIDANGELRWMKRLPKVQIGGRGKGGMSFRHYTSGNSQYFMYVDNPKNIDQSFGEKPARYTDGPGGYLTVYKIDDHSGKVSKESLFDMNDVQGLDVAQFSTSRIIPVGGGVVCIEVYKRYKEDVLIKVGAGI